MYSHGSNCACCTTLASSSRRHDVISCLLVSSVMYTTPLWVYLKRFDPSRPGLAASFLPCFTAACNSRFSIFRSSRRSRPCVCDTNDTADVANSSSLVNTDDGAVLLSDVELAPADAAAAAAAAADGFIFCNNAFPAALAVVASGCFFILMPRDDEAAPAVRRSAAKNEEMKGPSEIREKIGLLNPTQKTVRTVRSLTIFPVQHFLTTSSHVRTIRP